MRPSVRNATITLALVAWLVADCGTARAEKGGRGGGGGGRGGGHGGGSRSAAGHHARGGKPTTHRVKEDAPQGYASGVRNSHRGEDKHAIKDKRPKGGDAIASDRPAITRDENHPWSMQRANEERKLNHRLGVADKLERKADANGNEHLRSTAERMRQKAHEHYAKRLEKIDGKLPTSGKGDPLPDELPEDVPGEIPNDLSDARQPLAEFVDSQPAAPVADPKLTGQKNALSRQLRNEERKLAHQTELAERLRAIGEEQGDSALLEKANRIEQQALDRFENRMEAIRSFQQRHGLSADNSR
jgi:hypothetical protein